jgi:UDPglucose--hexose-1-phosphate uridylyltransferase
VSDPYAPHFRFDPWTDSWVAMAPGRKAIGAMRPGGMPPSSERCPFCAGHEADTELSTDEIGSPWRARSVLNRFPLTTTSQRRQALPPAAGAGDGSARLGQVSALAAHGAHEVIVESRHHDRDLAAMTPAEALDVLTLWRARSKALAQIEGVRAITLFRNKGRRAGSSQPHPHSQIVALPFVPPLVATHARTAEAHRAEHGGSLLAHLIERERAERSRIVTDADGVVSYCPYASMRAWWARLAIAPPVPRFADVSDAQLAILARRVPDLCARALSASGATDYNVYVADPPLGSDTGFVIEIVPRTGGDAGFEVSTGTSVCVVLPEDAAARMRDTSPGAT